MVVLPKALGEGVRVMVRSVPSPPRMMFALGMRLLLPDWDLFFQRTFCWDMLSRLREAAGEALSRLFLSLPLR